MLQASNTKLCFSFPWPSQKTNIFWIYWNLADNMLHCVLPWSHLVRNQILLKNKQIICRHLAFTFPEHPLRVFFLPSSTILMILLLNLFAFFRFHTILIVNWAHVLVWFWNLLRWRGIIHKFLRGLLKIRQDHFGLPPNYIVEHLSLIFRRLFNRKFIFGFDWIYLYLWVWFLKWVPYPLDTRYVRCHLV